MKISQIISFFLVLISSALAVDVVNDVPADELKGSVIVSEGRQLMMMGKKGMKPMMMMSMAPGGTRNLSETRNLGMMSMSPAGKGGMMMMMGKKGGMGKRELQSPQLSPQ
mmetsp:Transcript_4855/g.10319  ORF Transcript_4855/g.10319 Transcript_4855/m.10319 type:complete len:110 (-) Transcript_4855:278-607(-)|eukprot:CAMPEP_0172455956 /NCGR_PEP_ID=MMETSP1065-20121228/13301_1 /TAXON_ID=265537 /ORGANISM="Amphiprora paludosa, Strain CCMP125" /LENGTH=109 /DNA_ID=CAMNT_0013208509 /DNA_START=65 /DNA_END=394 /DNA_ORIENTATION=+